MHKQTSLYIPKPCHEDWNKMTPTQQGKFCASCNKQVVDFSLMSDNQVLNYFANHSGKLCGRFDETQLQRPLTETKIAKKKSWWMALTMPFTLFTKTEAQQNTQLTGDTIIKTENIQNDIQPQILGKVAFCKPVKNTMITGKVVDENNIPVAYASVNVKGTRQVTTADSSGNFSLSINDNDSVATLVVSCIGYEKMETEIYVNDKNIISIQMKSHEEVLKELVVVGYSQKFLVGVTAGGISVCRKVTAFERFDTSVKKIFNISFFKTYPNPVNKGNTIHLEIKEKGEYEWQLLDNLSRLIAAGDINALSAKSTSSITTPSDISSGIYYICLINQKTKRRNLEKLIVQ